MFILLLIFIIKDTMKLEEQLKRIKELISEGEGGTPRSKGGTSTDSSGQYMSAAAWQQDGILTTSGREEDIGELPHEIDDIGDDTEEITLTVDDVFGKKDPSTDMVDIIDDLVGEPASAVAPPPPSPLTGDDDYGDDDVPGGDRYDDGPTKPHRERPDKGEYVNPLDDMAPCCEPCGDGMWRNCYSDDCIYNSIADCELANQEGESNIESLNLSDIWNTE